MMILSKGNDLNVLEDLGRLSVMSYKGSNNRVIQLRTICCGRNYLASISSKHHDMSHSSCWN
jgi:hypothetical protein